MNKTVLGAVAIGALAAPMAANAMGSFMIGNQDIRLDGGITGSYIAESDTGNTKQDTIQVTDFILQFEREAEPGGVGFTSGVGSLFPPYLGMRGIQVAQGVQKGSANLGGGVISGPFKLYYGWVRVMPIKDLAIDIGRLESHVGYETDLTYQNRNIMLGLVRGAQPVFYDGARVSWWVHGIGIYAEVDKDAETMLAVGSAGTEAAGKLLGPGITEATADALGFGVEGKVAGIDGEFNYFSIQNNARIFDVVAETVIMGVDVAANADLIIESDALKKAVQAQFPGVSVDNGAYGAAFYATFHVFDKFTVPVRVEYVNDGNSGLYGIGYPGYLGEPGVSNSAVSFTVTPTYNFSPHTFVRAEFSFTTLDKTKNIDLVGFKDSNGQPTDRNTVFVLQAGTRF